MGKIFMISLILGTIVLSFYSLSLADEESKGISPTNSSNELIYGQWILQQKGTAPFAFPIKAGFGSALNGVKRDKIVGNREVPLDPVIKDVVHYPAAAEILERDLSPSENSQPSKGKFGYHFGKIHLVKDSLDHSLDFISRLAVENTPSWTLEKFKENDAFKSLAIFLELKLNF
jgi:hypothetical protein